MKLLFLLFPLPLLAASIAIDVGSPMDTYCTGPVYTIQTPDAAGDLTMRVSPACRIPTEPGLYTVSLFFRESGTVTAAGQRSFSVRLQGQETDITKFDLFAAAGLAPYRRDYVPVVSYGVITIATTTHSIPGVTPVRGAILSAIRIEPYELLSASATVTASRQADGSYVLRLTEAEPGTRTYDVAVYRAGVRMNPNTDYVLLPGSSGLLRIAPRGAWSEADIEVLLRGL